MTQMSGFRDSSGGGPPTNAYCSREGESSVRFITQSMLEELLEKLREKNAECLVISNDDHACSLGLKSMRLPIMPEWITPVAAVMPGQIFAMNLASVKGYNVDQPRGLTKVTVTR